MSHVTLFDKQFHVLQKYKLQKIIVEKRRINYLKIFLLEGSEVDFTIY